MANRVEKREFEDSRLEIPGTDGHRYERYVMESGCPVNAVEELEVTVPASVHAHTQIGDVTLRCMNAGTVVRNSDEVIGRPGAVSRFTIKQRLRVDIPVNFEVEAYVGEGHVNFQPGETGGSDSCRCE